MKKHLKLLLLAVLVLVAVMAFTVLVSASPEEPTGATTYEGGTHFFKVSIGETDYYYADLAAAVTDVPEGGIVTQLADVDYSAYMGDGDAVVAYVISGDKSYTLDGAGFTLKTPVGVGLQITGDTATAVVTLQNMVLDGTGGNYCLDTNASGTVKLINTSVTATYYVIHVRKAGTVWLADDAESETDKNSVNATSTGNSNVGAIQIGGDAAGVVLTVDNATITIPKSNAIQLGASATVTLNSGTTIVGCTDRQCVYVSKANSTGKVTFNGGSYQGQSLINAGVACNYEVYLNNVTLTAANHTYGIRTAGAATLKVVMKKSTIEAAQAPLYIGGASANVEITMDSDSKITSSWTGTTTQVKNTNGIIRLVGNNAVLALKGSGLIECTGTGSYAYVVNLYNGGSKLVLDGCTINSGATGSAAGAIFMAGTGTALEVKSGAINGKQSQAVYANAKCSVTVSGGSLSSTGQATMLFKVDAGTTIDISGGSFESASSISMPVFYLYPSGTAAASASNPGTITITGGTFHSVKPIVARGGTWNMDISGATALTTTKTGSTLPTYFAEVQDDSAITLNLGADNNIAANKLIYVRENKGAYASVTLTGGIYAVQTTALENVNPTNCTLTLNGGAVALKGEGSELYLNSGDGTVALTATSGAVHVYVGAILPLYEEGAMTNIDLVIAEVNPIVLDAAGVVTVASLDDLAALAADEIAAIMQNKDAFKSVTCGFKWIAVQLANAEAVLNITGGSYETDAAYFIDISAGTLNISDATFVGAKGGIRVLADGSAVINIVNTDFTAKGGYLYQLSGACTLKLQGGTHTSSSYGIYSATDVTRILEVSGGAVLKGTQAIYFTMGTTTLTITGKGTEVIGTKYNAVQAGNGDNANQYNIEVADGALLKTLNAHDAGNNCYAILCRGTTTDSSVVLNGGTLQGYTFGAIGVRNAAVSFIINSGTISTAGRWVMDNNSANVGASESTIVFNGGMVKNSNEAGLTSGNDICSMFKEIVPVFNRVVIISNAAKGVAVDVLEDGSLPLNANCATVMVGGEPYYTYVKMAATDATFDPTNSDEELFGASIDLFMNSSEETVETQSGLRFYTVLSTATVAALEAYMAENPTAKITYGTLIAPADYVVAAGAFTKEALGNLNVMVPYADVEAQNTREVNENGIVTAWSGALVNLKQTNFNRQFAAVSYITIELDGDSTTYYGAYDSAMCARSVQYIAQAMIADLDSDYNLIWIAAYPDKAALVEKYAAGIVTE